MSKKVYITWDEVFRRLDFVDFEGEIVYGIPKGGMIIAGFLNRAVVTHLPNEATIILDDIIDSGNTADIYREKYPEAKFVTLFDRAKDYPGGEWLVFPWEAEHPAGEDTAEDNITRVLQYIGENAKRVGLVDTPRRVVKMWAEIYRGYDPSQRPKTVVFPNSTDGICYDEMITDQGDFYSTCEHHMLPFFGQYYFAYIPSPKGNIIGLSKVARLVDYHAAKLQIQERLVTDIVDDIWDTLCAGGMEPPLGMALLMKGEHLCKTMRGVKKKGTMSTSCLRGVFLTKDSAMSEFLKISK